MLRLLEYYYTISIIRRYILINILSYSKALAIKHRKYSKSLLFLALAYLKNLEKRLIAVIILYLVTLL
ncbi:hypothetical protein HBH81_042550 [Parastagonospora nodorum]|nr:hypothetical protein HBH81_042550 [Parastagonospora nodorum]